DTAVGPDHRAYFLVGARYGTPEQRRDHAERRIGDFPTQRQAVLLILYSDEPELPGARDLRRHQGFDVTLPVERCVNVLEIVACPRHRLVAEALPDFENGTDGRDSICERGPIDLVQLRLRIGASDENQFELDVAYDIFPFVLLFGFLFAPRLEQFTE